MDKLLISSLVALLILGCGGPKKETSPQSTTAQSGFIAITKVIDSMCVISLEKKGPYAEVGKAFAELTSRALLNKVTITGTPFAIYYDDPNKVIPESTRYEVCIPVASSTKEDKLIKIKKLPPTEVASTIYIGPYDKIGPTYLNFMSWLEKNNYIISGPAREIYLNDPSKVPAESLKTEIQFPIKKKT
ncbi:MAG: GyrI-like domain-containing protein [candidate division WOR-3 bacterium]|nr:GyrI-like domain-containing protein [candidate division WOR-3 bacterium]